jgi:hypothetical protein
MLGVDIKGKTTLKHHAGPNIKGKSMLERHVDGEYKRERHA